MSLLKIQQIISLSEVNITLSLLIPFALCLELQKSKGFVTETEQRSSDIQRLFEMSIQRSSCESDKYKDRLFVYFDEHGTMPLSTSATGVSIHSII